METPRRFPITLLTQILNFLIINVLLWEKITSFFLLLSRVIQVSSDRSYLINRPNISFEARERALRKAEEIESQLDPNFPSFVRSMLHSHVTKGFWFVRTLNSVLNLALNSSQSFIFQSQYGIRNNELIKPRCILKS
jgi:hypothetical protein